MHLLPPVAQISEYVWMIPHPLPSDHPEFIATYVVLDKSGDIHVIDPGWDSEQNWEELQRGLLKLGWMPKDIHSVTLTHQHRDHVGMATHIKAESGCPIGMHRLEEQELLINFLPQAEQQRTELLEDWRVPQEFLESLQREVETQTQNTPPAIEADLHLEDGDYLLVPGRNLRIHHTPGHTPGHICIEDLDTKHVFTGDHVLGQFNPGVGLGKVWRNDSMLSYLDSLEKLLSISGAIGLPGHGPIIEDLNARCLEIMNHHLNRISAVSNFVSSSSEASAWEVAKHLKWTKPWDSMNPTTRRMVIAQSAMYLHAAINIT